MIFRMSHDNGKWCSKALKIYFLGCDLTLASPDCNVKIDDLWDGEQNSNVYKVETRTIVEKTCHDIT